MADPLKSTAFTSVTWTALSTFCRLGLQFAFSVILARLLSPADFGVMAIMMVVNAVALSLIDSGFSQALIQKRDVTEVEQNSVFLLGLVVASLMSLVLVAGAPLLAGFFDMPILKPVAQVLSLNFVIVALGGVHTAMLLKHLQFKKLMKVNVGAALIASLAAMYLAATGWGVWSLVVYSLSTSLMTTAGLWLWSGWRPGWDFSFAALRPLFRFGIFMLGAGLLETLLGRINPLLIGRFYSASQLGYYSRAESTQHLFHHMFASIVNQVAFPLFSSVAADGPRLLAGYKKAVKISFYLQAPAMVGLLLTAAPLVITLFGSKWEASVPLLQLFALSGMFSLPRMVVIGMLNATGRSRLYFQTELFQKIAGVVGALATVRIGISAMLVSMILVNAASYFWTANLAGRDTGFSCLRQLADSSKVFMAAFVMGLCVWRIGLVGGLPVVGVLTLQVLTGAAVYALMCALLRVAEQKEMLIHARGLLRSRMAATA
jgi:teichuronic acid exporter